MANQKYKFERLTPIDNMDLDVYEEAIDYYIMSNMDDYFVTWLSENIECTISGISTHDEALKMITSLNQS